MNWSRLFSFVSRFNSIAIFAILIVGGAILAIQWFGYSPHVDYRSAGEKEWARDAEDPLFAGREVNTADGSVIAYEVSDDENMGVRPGSNVSLVNMRTGQTRKIAPDGYSVANWELLFFHGDDKSTAVGYMAFVSNPVQFKQGRMDLVVGTLPELEQSVVAQNIVAADLPTIHGDGSLVMVMWPENDTAMFVTIDVAKGEIVNRVRVPLPHISANMTSGTGVPDSPNPYPFPRAARRSNGAPNGIFAF